MKAPATVLAVLVLFVLILSPNPAPAATLATGRDFSCAVVDEGVECWGANFFGQLGNPAFGDVSRATPVSTLEPGTHAGATAVSAGDGFACAVVNGGVKCWGRNFEGELGDGTTTPRSTPVSAIAANSGALGISSGSQHSCAVVNSSVMCWGNNDFSQLGDGATADRSVPWPTIPGNATAVSAGRSHTCALVSGNLWCWGSNASGELGDKTTAVASLPEQISSGINVSAVAAGDENTCIIADGAAKCWGLGQYYLLGNGSLANLSDATQAVPVPGASANVTSISVGLSHACAVVSGVAKCWGFNTKGQLGTGSTNLAQVATAVSNLAAASEVAVLGDHSCARESNATGSLKCWGADGHGQLGNGHDERFLAPTSVPLGNGNSAKAVALGNLHGCVLLTNGSVRCWGDNFAGQMGDANSGGAHFFPVAVNGLSGSATALSNGRIHSCVVEGGAAKCWGGNFSGQLGFSMPITSNAPLVPLSSQKGVKAIAAGSSHTCAVASDGVYCWGDNSHGQVGDANDLSAHKAPYKIPALANANVKAISAGNLHTCAVVDDGVKCWGINTSGQAGKPNDSSDQLLPYATIPSGQNVTAIAAGANHTCAVVNGDVQCWGSNYYGQLGDGTNKTSFSPVLSPYFYGGYGVSSIVTGDNHTCVLAFGAVFCWGSGDYGELGTGTHDDWALPIAPLGLGFYPGANVTGIAAGAFGSCAIIDGGQHLNCWGQNTQGALGVTVNDFQSIALPVEQNDVLFASRFEIKP